VNVNGKETPRATRNTAISFRVNEDSRYRSDRCLLYRASAPAFRINHLSFLCSCEVSDSFAKVLRHLRDTTSTDILASRNRKRMRRCTALSIDHGSVKHQSAEGRWSWFIWCTRPCNPGFVYASRRCPPPSLPPLPMQHDPRRSAFFQHLEPTTTSNRRTQSPKIDKCTRSDIWERSEKNILTHTPIVIAAMPLVRGQRQLSERVLSTSPTYTSVRNASIRQVNLE
jgi:hypothetical protein